jgi:hypothetical protein
VADAILNKVDIQANKKGLSRSGWIAEAIESAITGSNQSAEDLHKANLELNKAQTS